MLNNSVVSAPMSLAPLMPSMPSFSSLTSLVLTRFFDTWLLYSLFFRGNNFHYCWVFISFSMDPLHTSFYNLLLRTCQLSPK